MFKKLRNMLGLGAAAVVVTTGVNTTDDIEKIAVNKQEQANRAFLQQHFQTKTVSGQMQKCTPNKEFKTKKTNKHKKAPKMCIKP